MSPRNFSPGSGYKDGKLYLFSGSDLLVVRAWPQPMAWRLELEGPWRGARPVGLELDAPDRLAALPEDHRLSEFQLRRLRAQAQAYGAIPEDRRREALRFGKRSWGMHVLFTRVPGALELARVHPALAVGLAFPGHLRPRIARPLRAARTLLAKPGPQTAQRVAGWLGFDPSRAVVRTLRKLEHFQCSPWKLALLQRALAQLDTHKLLCHLPAFNGSVFALLEQLLEPGSPVVSANALALELAALGPELRRDVEELLRESAAEWTRAFPQQPMPPLRSLEQLEQLHIDAQAKLGSAVYHWGGRRQLYPPPPVMGITTPSVRIQPLSSPSLQRAEGRGMRHCVGNGLYVYKAARGSGYAYAVRLILGGEEQRATAWVVAKRDGSVRLASLRGRSNEKPIPELLVATQAWIDVHNQMVLEGRFQPMEHRVFNPGGCPPRYWTLEGGLYEALEDVPPGAYVGEGELEYDDMPF
jgi:hypothetical protein